MKSDHKQFDDGVKKLGNSYEGLNLPKDERPSGERRFSPWGELREGG